MSSNNAPSRPATGSRQRSLLIPITLVIIILLIIGGTCREARAFAYRFSGGTGGQATVTHPYGYSSQGGLIELSIGINPLSPNASDMEISVQNAIDTWNALESTTGNLSYGESNNIPAGHYDFESVVLHEIGHVLGLDHSNIGQAQGVSGSNMDHTISEAGPNGVYNLNAGADGVIGSRDDLRGDDVNLNWFNVATNDPFAANSKGVYDTTTFSPYLSDLPADDSFSANGSRAVASTLGLTNTESVMQQGARPDEAQRTLTEDDVAGIRLGMTGQDMIQGTADDYVINLTYAGFNSDADVVVDFDNETSFALTTGIGLYAGAGHKTMYSTGIHFNTDWDWFFNDVRNNQPVLGDTDGDGDVDNTDIQAAFTNFTGPSGTGKTREQGDVDPHPDGDGDVDNSDIQLIFREFTGPGEGGDTLFATADMHSAEPQDAPDLIYDAATGEVILDAGGSQILAYTLRNSANQFSPNDQSSVLNGVSTLQAFEISESTLSPVTGQHSLGTVFPRGLSQQEVSSLLSTNSVSQSLGTAPTTFDIVVIGMAVPEPSAIFVSLFGLLGFAFVAIRKACRNETKTSPGVELPQVELAEVQSTD